MVLVVENGSAASSALSSPRALPPPSHRSPPRYPDFYGKHRKQAEMQILNREIGFLKEELQSIGDLKPASSCCKEVDEFVGRNPDPMIPLDWKTNRRFRIRKWICGKSCFKASWIFFSSGCLCHPRMPRCACPRGCRCWCYCNGCSSGCFQKSNCKFCCVVPYLSCPNCSCRCASSCLRCRKVSNCLNCIRNCCFSCYLCS